MEETAKVLMQRFRENNTDGGIGFTDGAFRAGATAAAAAVEGEPYTVRDAAAEFDVDKKYVARVKQAIEKECNLDLAPPEPGDYLERFCREVGVDFDDAQELYGHIPAHEYTGRSPATAAAAIVWLAGLSQRNSPNQHDIADIANTSTVSLRNHASDFKPYL